MQVSRQCGWPRDREGGQGINARPFKWTKTADQILDRICRYCSRISGRAHLEIVTVPDVALIVTAPMQVPCGLSTR